MSILALTLPGEYVDAYVYADMLVAWDRSGDIITWSMSDLADAAADSHLLPKAIAKASFDDNRLWDNREDSLTSQWVTDESVHISVAPTLVARTGFGGVSLYDMLVTQFVLFVSSSEGLFSVPLGSLHQRSRSQELNQRIDGRVLSTQYHLGSVIAAAGMGGTWALVNEFNYVRDLARKSRQFTDTPAAKSGGFGTTLYEVDTLGGHSFYDAVLREGSPRSGGKTRYPRVAVDVSRYAEDRVYTPFLNRMDSASTGEARWLPIGSSFARMVDRQLWLTRLGRWEGDLLERTDVAVIADDLESVWDVTETEGGYAIETQSGLLGVERTRYVTMSSRPVISMRAYPNSRRYRKIVTATTGDGLTVYCMTGAHPFPRRNERDPEAPDVLSGSRMDRGGFSTVRVAPEGRTRDPF